MSGPRARRACVRAERECVRARAERCTARKRHAYARVSLSRVEKSASRFEMPGGGRRVRVLVLDVAASSLHARTHASPRAGARTPSARTSLSPTPCSPLPPLDTQPIHPQASYHVAVVLSEDRASPRGLRRLRSTGARQQETYLIIINNPQSSFFFLISLPPACKSTCALDLLMVRVGGGVERTNHQKGY